MSRSYTPTSTLPSSDSEENIIDVQYANQDPEEITVEESEEDYYDSAPEIEESLRQRREYDLENDRAKIRRIVNRTPFTNSANSSRPTSAVFYNTDDEKDSQSDDTSSNFDDESDPEMPNSIARVYTREEIRAIGRAFTRDRES